MHAHVPLCNMHWLKRLYSSFKWGEFVLVENQKGRQRVFQLKEGSLLNSSAGQVPHSEIVGKLPCQAFETDRSIKVWVRRPTLAEYVCLMQRAATPSYPKDIWAMLGYLDITGGARVIEAGSGSGGLTLHLSNQVGPSGHVYSFEIVHKHLAQAEKNYHNWCCSWYCHHPDSPWPNNVQFIENSVSSAQDYIDNPVDAVALDLVNPCTVMDSLVDVLRPGSILAAYLPNITQVLDLRVHLEKRQLPFIWEKVVEVVHRDWAVKPAIRKHRAALERLQLSNRSDVSLAYIARPSHLQDPHTAFLVVLRCSVVSMGKLEGI